MPRLVLAHRGAVAKKAAIARSLHCGADYGVRGCIRMLSAEFEDLFDGR